VIIDIYPGAMLAARDAGVPTLQAELLSRSAEEGMADHPPDHLLAATRDELYNALVCTRLAPEIGRERVYQVAPSENHLLHADTGVSRDARGKVFGDADASFDALAGRHEAGWRFLVAGPDAVEQPDSIHLLAIKADGSLEFFSVDHEENDVGEGDRVLILQAPSRTEIDADDRPAMLFA
jgi:hypothetical protein